MDQANGKGIVLLKAKVMNYDCINNKLLLKLFDCLIRPILTYGSEIWICDFNVKESSRQITRSKNSITDFASIYLVSIEDRIILHQGLNLAEKGY